MYNAGGENEPFAFSVVNQINNYEIVFVDVQIGCFNLIVKILNIDKNSPLSKTNESSGGNYGNVYYCTLQGSEVAIKSMGYC